MYVPRKPSTPILPIIVPHEKHMMEKIFLLDAIGPFFHDYEKKVVNWSKIPFDHLEKKSKLKKKYLDEIEAKFKIFIQTAQKAGYNAISLDDLAHLVLFDIYPDHLKKKISHYRSFFGKLIGYTKKKGLLVYLTTDIMFFNDPLNKFVCASLERIVECFKIACEQVFSDFPIDGIITRIGEQDGNDVEGEFLSSLCIKTPQEANLFIRSALPLFRKWKKTWIFRTWTVGAYPIGDLMWNTATYDKVFDHIDDEHFIVSMKHGETDFFGFLELTPLLFRGPQRKLLELQTRREREGFGLFPNYMGWELQSFRDKVEKNPSFSGVSVWCQTGGWSRNKDITFLEKSSPWVELNTYAVPKLFRYMKNADDFLQTYFQSKKDEIWVRLIKKFKGVFDDILYPPFFRNNPLYFRRIRVPSLLWMTWNNVTVTPLMAGLFHSFRIGVPNTTLRDLEELEELAQQVDLPKRKYINALLRILYLCRKTLSSTYPPSKLTRKIGKFLDDYPESVYRFQVTLQDQSYSFAAARLFRLFTRFRRNYTLLDRLTMIPLVSKSIMKITRWILSKNLPKLVDRKAMPLETLFR